MQQPPFTKLHQISNMLDSVETLSTEQFQNLRLPGRPQIYMNDPKKIQDCLAREFLLRDLEKISPHLWLMSKHDSQSISPLHRQKVKGRQIIITEDPRLHLVWHHDRIFIKPLPQYLLSYTFWNIYLSNGPDSPAEKGILRKAVLGYLRTYFYLIRYESDFHIAANENLRLIPSDITFLDFCDFIATFEHIRDADVSGRYSYGEIRLTRLNVYAKIFLGRFSFHRVRPQYSDYFASFYGPLLFVFAIVSVVLSAMQVGMAVESLEATKRWRGYWVFCRYFNVVCLIGVAVLVVWLVMLFLYKFSREWIYAITEHWKRKRLY